MSKKVVKPDDTQVLRYGKFKITLKPLNVIDGLQYIPLINFITSNIAIDPDLLEALQKQLKQAKTEDEKNKIARQIENVSRASTEEALKKLTDTDKKLLLSFITDTIDDWNAKVDITPENVAKLPFYIFYDVFMVAVSMFMVSGNDLDFFGIETEEDPTHT